MAKYSRALTNTNDILISNDLPFLVDYMEKNNDFNPEKEYLISKKKSKKISVLEEINEESHHLQVQDIKAS